MEVEKVYTRSKSIFINENAVEELLLFAGLHQVTLREKQDGSFGKVSVVRSELVEMPVEDAPLSYSNMPDHELRVVISDEEFSKLRYISEEEIERFYTYVPKAKEGYEVEYTEVV